MRRIGVPVVVRAHVGVLWAIALFTLAITVGQRDTAIAASQPLFTFSTPDPQVSGTFGLSVASADVNGDGQVDVIVGAPERVYVYSGTDDSPLYAFSSPNPQPRTWFGSAVAGGDVNADGMVDIIVGNSRDPRVYIFSGADGSLVSTLVKPTDAPVVSVAVGDVNRDGRDDVIVGSVNADEGRVHVFSGADGALMFTLTTPNPEPLGWFGAAVAGGDVTGDGVADVIVGANGETVGAAQAQGRAYIFSGADGSLVRSITTPNPQAHGQFGSSVSSGDVDHDGFADVVVGAKSENVGATTDQGRVYAFSGASGTLLLTLTTPSPRAYAFFGSSVAARDISVSGRFDIVVGAPGETVGDNPYQGRAYVFYGGDGTLLFAVDSANPQWYGEFGQAVAAGDVNGDAKGDILVGAYMETVNDPPSVGRTYVFAGPPACLDDSDCDGCGDVNEPLLSAVLDAYTPWDFYSVPVPALFAAPNPGGLLRDSSVSVQDAQAVLPTSKGVRSPAGRSTSRT